ncbi:MAG TPA: hypothetical protein VFW50_05185 [Streptosporangiaceae bacterium]|nr:hypothetical protein [Streptosporangiaceae bacterium]
MRPAQTSSAVLVVPMRRRPARNSSGATAPARTPSSRSRMARPGSVTGASAVPGSVTAASAPSPAAAAEHDVGGMQDGRQNPNAAGSRPRWHAARATGPSNANASADATTSTAPVAAGLVPGPADSMTGRRIARDTHEQW